MPMLKILAALMLAHVFFVSEAFSFSKPSERRMAPVQLVVNEWCPQHCSQGELRGYVIEIVEQALQEESIPFEISYQPWLRALRDVEKGRKDGVLTPTVPGFSQFIYHEEALGFQEYCFYAPRSSPWTFRTNSDLLGQRVAFLDESGLGALETYMTENAGRIAVTRFASGDHNYVDRIFQFLMTGRTDLVIITSDVYEFSLKHGVIPDEFRNAGCLGKEKMAVGLSKADEKRSLLIWKALDRGIRKLRQKGQLKEILRKYGLTDWQKP
jgi:polar amino acid transport system substrate-binding protein